MKNILFGIVFVSPPFLKKVILKWFCGAQFGRKSNIGWFSSIMGCKIILGDYSSVKPFTLIRCDGEVRIGNYTEISSFSVIYGSANFVVGDKCYIGPQTWINVTEDVVLGNVVCIGPRTMIFTHGSFLPYTEGYPVRFRKVSIGDNVWIAAGVFLHPGVEIGKNVFVNSRSVITRSISSGQIVEGFPAKEIGRIERICRIVNPMKRDVLIERILKHFAAHVNQVKPSITMVHNNDDVLVFKLSSRTYAIGLVGHRGIIPNDLKNSKYKRIALINFSDFNAISSDGKMMMFDFTRMKASFSKDNIFHELYLFLRQYYGIIFEYK